VFTKTGKRRHDDTVHRSLVTERDADLARHRLPEGDIELAIVVVVRGDGEAVRRFSRARCPLS
jgi:hypothetical protein